jgi:hypothetical protein
MLRSEGVEWVVIQNHPLVHSRGDAVFREALARECKLEAQFDPFAPGGGHLSMIPSTRSTSLMRSSAGFAGRVLASRSIGFSRPESVPASLGFHMGDQAHSDR